MTRRNTVGGHRAVLLVLIATFAVTVTPLNGAPGALAATGEEDVIIDGAGWGHGIGMSQYGARGQALDGRTGEEIVEYYYADSTVSDLESLLPEGHFLADDTSPLWISLERNATVFRFRAIDGPIEMCHPTNGGCSLTANPGESWTFVALGNGTCRFRVNGSNATGGAGPCTATIRGLSATGGKARLDNQPTTRDEYARGRIQLRTPDDGSSIHASLEIGIERYLFGLAEVPDWPETEALRAQAIAARSYATWKAQLYGPEETWTDTPDGRRDKCWCHLYATVVDQSFIGWDREDQPAEQPWVDAVNSTAGFVASHPSASQNNVVAAFYSSSTGGATQNVEDVWGGAPVEYLRSVPDPWSTDPGVGNPFDSWSFRFSEAELAAELGLDAVSGLDIAARHDSGAPSRIRITGRLDGKRYSKVWSGAAVKSTLGLTGRHIFAIDHGSTHFVTGDFDGKGTGDVAALVGATGAWFEYSDGGRARSWGNHNDNATITSPVTGDFDGDGIDDIAIRRSHTGAWIVGIGGGGGFSPRFWGAGVPDPSAWDKGLVGDFDGDGRDDIAEYRPDTGTWAVLRSTGSSYARSSFYDFAVEDPQWGAFIVADFDADGLDDILHHDLVTDDLHVLYSDGAAFEAVPWATMPDAVWRLRTGDFDGDGRADVASFDTSTGAWWVTPAIAGRSGGSPAIWWTFNTVDFVDQVVGDFDGDGRDDIANLDEGRRMRMLTAKSSGGFTWGMWGRTPRGDTVSELLVLDADDDGDADIITYNPTTKLFHIHTSSGNGFSIAWWGSLLK